MKFYTRKRRSPAVIIVSLIDILAILLIFFIVTTTFKKDQPQLEINLPESRTAAPAADAPVEPMVLRVKNADEIMLDTESVPLDDLAARIRSAREEYPERPLAMQADRDAAFGVVVQVLDALKEAGVQNIPAFTDPKPEAAAPIPAP